MPVRAPVAPTASWQSISLLLVEDDRADAVLVEDLIADAATDIRVVWAQSMAHAEQELAAARPDCVLLDLHLPDANGIDALDRIARVKDDLIVRQLDRAQGCSQGGHIGLWKTLE